MTLQDDPNGTLRDTTTPKRERMPNTESWGMIPFFFVVLAVLGLGYALYTTYDTTSPTTRTTESARPGVVNPTTPPVPVTPAPAPKQP
jgi:hypothetical protein